MSRDTVPELLKPFYQDVYLMWFQDMRQTGGEIVDRLFSMSAEERRQWRESVIPPGVQDAIDASEELLEQLSKEK